MYCYLSSIHEKVPEREAYERAAIDSTHILVQFHSPLRQATVDFYPPISGLACNIGKTEYRDLVQRPQVLLSSLNLLEGKAGTCK